METSPTITEIAKALVGFHKEVGKIAKDSKNPFFKSSYASLSGILDAIQEPLINNGLSIVQFPDGENGLTTRLIHTSGEWMEATYFMKSVKDTPQDRGSAITYQRRYALAAILSLNVDDDDGNTASGRTGSTIVKKDPAVQALPEWAGDISKAKTQKDLVDIYNAHKSDIDNSQFLREAISLKRQTLSKPSLNGN